MLRGFAHFFRISFRSLVSFGVFVVFVTTLVAHAATESEDPEDDDVEVQKPKNYLTLTLGSDHDEKVQKMPSFIKFKGDFKRIARASYLKKDGIIRFTPVKEGNGTITIVNSKGVRISEYRLVVRRGKLDTVMREVRSLLGDIEGITFRILNGKVLIDGQILLPRDMNRIYTVVSQYGDQVSSIVGLSPLAQKKIAEFIARDINNPDVEVRTVNDKFILQGSVASEDEKNRAEIIAKTYVPDEIVEKSVADGVIKKRKANNDGVINLITIKPAAAPPPGKTVQLVIHYVELQKDYTKAFRFQFTPNLNDSSGVTFSTGDNGGGSSTSLTGTINNLLPKLNWAKQHGYARVLESSTLLVEEGRKGVLNSFQEVPYTTTNPQSQTGAPITAFKKVGLQSAITPIILGERSDSIKLTMEFELSALVGSTQAGPLTSNNQLNTELTIRSGNSAAVGGLITNRSVTGFNKLPAGASENPIISLYNSKDFQKNQSQFVVFITPIIKASASSGSEKIKKKFRLGQ